MPPKKVYPLLQRAHDDAFDTVNCLDCGNCCKGYSPRFKTPDIKRLGKRLKMKESIFIDTFLRIDEDGDYVTQSPPCPFLLQDNTCSVYEDRPSDCRRFPYTDEDVFMKRNAITLTNAGFCPAVYLVFEKLMDETGFGASKK